MGWAGYSVRIERWKAAPVSEGGEGRGGEGRGGGRGGELCMHSDFTTLGLVEYDADKS